MWPQQNPRPLNTDDNGLAEHRSSLQSSSVEGIGNPLKKGLSVLLKYFGFNPGRSTRSLWARLPNELPPYPQEPHPERGPVVPPPDYFSSQLSHPRSQYVAGRGEWAPMEWALGDQGVVGAGSVTPRSRRSVYLSAGKDSNNSEIVGLNSIIVSPIPQTYENGSSFFQFRTRSALFPRLPRIR